MDEWSELAHAAATEMDEKDAAVLEARVEADPSDVEARVKLAAGYFHLGRWPREQVRRGEHLVWLAEHRPEIALGTYGTLISELAPDQHAAVLAAWRAAVAVEDVDLRVLANAAQFIGFEQPSEGAELYRRAIAREPDARSWREELAHKLILCARHDETDRAIAIAAEAVAEIEVALRLADDDGTALGIRIRLLEALRLAERWTDLEATARRVLADNEACARGWRYGNAIHDANVELGWCAYVRGDLDEAVAHLRLAGQTPGSPQLASFGPDIELARALLAIGKRDAVRAYLVDCRTFWPSGGDQLDAWLDAIDRGEKKLPELDDESA